MSVNTKVNGQLVPSAGLYSVTKPIGMADIYSTEEKEVGLWIDNRPLYQKTYVFGADVTVSHDTFTNLTAFTIPTNIDYIRNAECFRIGNKGLLSIDCALVASGGSTYIAIRNSSAYDITVASGSTLTITYTKTTDTPWSGKFVPQGYGYVSSGDIYSFEERQVGVWANGKPLYQKTVDLGTVSASGNKTVAYSDIGISDVETVVYFDVIINNQFNSNFNRPDSVNAEFYTQLVATGIFIRAYNNAVTSAYATLQYTKTTDVAGGESIPSGGGGTDLITTLAEMGITATFVGDYSEMYNDFNHIVRLKDATMNGQGVYFTNNQHFGGVDLPLTLAVRARKGMIQIGYGTGTLPTMITEGTGRTQFRNIPAGGFDTITIPYGSIGFIGKYFVSEDASKECVFEIGF